MVKSIIWTKRAGDKFSSMLEYLESDWGSNVAQNFAVRTVSIIELLSKNPVLGFVEVPEKGIRGFTLTKHNLVFYRVADNKSLLAVFNS